MGLLFQLIAQMRNWDRPSQVALGLALVLLLLALLLAAAGPEALRQPSLIAAAGLVIISQVIVLWGNRQMVTPYTRAQRHYLRGEFEQARQVLEAALAETKKPGADPLTLLGNTYRQLGQLEQSAAALQQACEQTPAYHFPLYGLGQTLLAMGDYAGAAGYTQKALSCGAPSVVQFDLGHALYRMGQVERAREALQDAAPHLQEAYRVLMQEYLLYKLGAAAPPAAEKIAAGLPFWQAGCERFYHTVYGAALRDDLMELQALLKEA